MNRHGQTICLAMIVKNEAPVIRRCLDSVRPLIDTWVIVDTGSIDGTQAVIREHLAALPGEVIERPWVDFAHNRSESLQFARGRADYVVIIDADEILQLDPGFVLPELTADSYNGRVLYGGCSYQRKMLVRNALPWRYEGVLHEYLRCDDAKTEEYLDGLVTVPHRDGARARDPQTYRRDALVLERALLENPDNARYVFYLAQSYRDCGDDELAIRHYKRRAAMGGWPEEVWYSLYQIAQLEERRGTPWPEVMQHYLAAHQFRPDRAGPLFRIGSYYQRKKEFATSYLFFDAAMRIPLPAHDRLFVERAVYDIHLPVEYGVSCFYTGRHAEAIAVNNRLLASPALPPQLIDHVTRNRRFSLEALTPRTPNVAAPVTMKIVVSFRDPGHELDDLVDSLLRQEMRDFEAIFIDEGSHSDQSSRLPLDDPRFSVRHDVPSDWDAEDVIVSLTPSDRFADASTLATIRAAFEDPACALLYGQFRLATGRLGNAWPHATAEAFNSGFAATGRSLLAYRARLARESATRESIWSAAGFANTRFTDAVLTIASERPARERAARVEVTEPDPMISCLLVTRDRLSLVKRAIHSYADQTWTNRELVIVTDGTPRFRAAVESLVRESRIDGVRFVIPGRDDLPLGALRNLSIDSARGEIICQYDDDDVSHPQRLATQAGLMLRSGARACFMTDHLQHLTDQRCVLWIDWTLGGKMQGTQRLAPGTLMMFRDPQFRYPEEGDYAKRGEDSVLLEQLAARIPIAELSGMGHLYLYQWHGGNTFPKEHHYRMAQCGAPRAFLEERAAQIRDALDYYEIARPAVVAGPDGPSFYIG